MRHYNGWYWCYILSSSYKNLDNHNYELGLLMLKISYSMKKVLAKSTGELYVPKTTVSNLKLIVS